MLEIHRRTKHGASLHGKAIASARTWNRLIKLKAANAEWLANFPPDLPLLTWERQARQLNPSMDMWSLSFRTDVLRAQELLCAPAEPSALIGGNRFAAILASEQRPAGKKRRRTSLGGGIAGNLAELSLGDTPNGWRPGACRHGT